jgi:hypothetical protein
VSVPLRASKQMRFQCLKNDLLEKARINGQTKRTTLFRGSTIEKWRSSTAAYLSNTGLILP